jgi:O-antigen ligase
MKNSVFSPEWLTDKFIWLMLGVFPLWCVGGYANITQSKFLFFACATAVWAVFLIIACLVRKRKRIHFGQGAYAVAGLLAVSILSWLLSSYRSECFLNAGRYDGLLSLILYAVIFLGVSAFGQWKAAYVWIFNGSLFLSAIISLSQLLGNNPLHLFPQGWNYFDGGIRFPSTFLGTIGNVDLYCIPLGMCVPLTLVWLLQNGLKKRNILLAFFCCINLFIGLECGVSAFRLGLLAAGLFLCIYALRRKSFRKRFVILLVACLLTVAASRCIQFTKDGPVISFQSAQEDTSPATTGNQSTIQELEEMLHGNWDDQFGSGRIGIWKTCLKACKYHLLLGTGPGTVEKRIQIHYSRYVPETGETLRTYVDNAHNEYLEYLMDEGLLGLLCYLALLFMTIAAYFRRKPVTAAGLFFGLLEYWVESFFGLGLCLVQPCVWLLWGLFWSEVKSKTANEKLPLNVPVKEF